MGSLWIRALYVLSPDPVTVTYWVSINQNKHKLFSITVRGWRIKEEGAVGVIIMLPLLWHVC